MPVSYLGAHGSNQLEDITLRRCLLIPWRLLSRRLDLAAPEAFTGQHESLCWLRIALPLHAQHRSPAGLHSCCRGVLWEGAGCDGRSLQFRRTLRRVGRHTYALRSRPHVVGEAKWSQPLVACGVLPTEGELLGLLGKLGPWQVLSAASLSGPIFMPPA